MVAADLEKIVVHASNDDDDDGGDDNDDGNCLVHNNLLVVVLMIHYAMGSVDKYIELMFFFSIKFWTYVLIEQYNSGIHLI